MGATDDEMRAQKARDRAGRSLRDQGTVSKITGNVATVSLGLTDVDAVIPASVQGVVTGATVRLQMSNTPTIEAVLTGTLLRARNTSGQTITTSLVAVANWTVDVAEIGGFDATTGIFTAPGACSLRAKATVSRNNSAAMRLLVQLVRNGTEERDRADISGASGRMSLHVDDIVAMAAGDTLEVRVLAGTTGSSLAADGPITKLTLEIR